MGPKNCYVLYHADCDDGFTAAWITRNAGLESQYEHVRYIPIQYGHPIPEMTHGSDVIMLDYCADGEILKIMFQQHNSLWIIDHHRTSIPWAKSLIEYVKDQGGVSVAEESIDGPYITFDAIIGGDEAGRLAGKSVRVYHNTSHSGAMLTALEFPVEQKHMTLIEYVQDRDLWRWALVGSREISAYIRSFPRTDKDWNELAEILDADLTRRAAMDIGLGILRADTEKCRFVAAKAKPARFRAKVAYGVCARMLTSELCHEMLALYPKAHFVFAYHHDGDGFVYSLRSRQNQNVDVSEIAKEYGGGGHKNAAGFKASSLVHLEWDSQEE